MLNAIKNSEANSDDGTDLYANSTETNYDDDEANLKDGIMVMMAI